MADFDYNQDPDQDALLREVRLHADQLTASGQTVGQDDADVYGHLVRAMRQVINGAPREALDKAANDGSGGQVDNTQSYTEVEVPDDFSRFMLLRLESWNADVYDLADPRSSKVQLQFNEATRNDSYAPVATKIPDPGGDTGEALQCWPQGEGPTLEVFAYVPEMAPEDTPDVLGDAIILWATSYLLSSQREDGWSVMRDAASILLRQIKVGELMTRQEAIEQAQN